MIALAPDLWFLPALGLAAGVDLYLTLLALGLASRVGLWGPLPGGLGHLDSTGVMIVAGAFFLSELLAERRLVTALVWNALHAIIRPLAVGLLSLLVLEGQGPIWLLVGSVGTAALASLAHATATGGSLLLRLSATERVRPLFVGLLEDAAVAGLLFLALDRPGWSAAVTGLLVVGALLRTRSNLVAFSFGLRLGAGRIRHLIHGRGSWLQGPRLPGRILESLEVEPSVPETLRAIPAALVSLPGAPPILRGWLLAGMEGPWFVPKRRLPAVDLSTPRPTGLEVDPLHRTVRLDVGRPALLYLVADGPSTETLCFELGLPTPGESLRGGGTPSSSDG